ncbi:MAG: hypothetical protein WCO81_12045 [Cyanobacteriota bacterium ELA615]|jgi:hypothetical protein
MITQIVRPLVENQIRLLANSKTTQETLSQTIACWLGYIGVRTEVTQLIPNSDRISVELTVSKPEFCSDQDWQKILNNLINPSNDRATAQSNDDELAKLVQLSRLLAYLIQISSNKSDNNWEIIEKQLSPLNLDQITLEAVRSALKVPQSINAAEKLDPDIAARAFPLAVKIAWMDHLISAEESDVLKSLLSLIAPDMKI